MQANILPEFPFWCSSFVRFDGFPSSLFPGIGDFSEKKKLLDDLLTLLKQSSKLVKNIEEGTP